MERVLFGRDPQDEKINILKFEQCGEAFSYEIGLSGVQELCLKIMVGSCWNHLFLNLVALDAIINNKIRLYLKPVH